MYMYVCQAQTFSARLVLLDRVINNLTNYMHVQASGMKNVVHRGGSRGGSGGSNEPPWAPKTTHCTCVLIWLGQAMILASRTPP